MTYHGVNIFFETHSILHRKTSFFFSDFFLTLQCFVDFGSHLEGVRFGEQGHVAIVVSQDLAVRRYEWLAERDYFTRRP